MAKLIGQNLGNKDNYRLKVDLSELGDLSSSEKQQVGQAIIDKILERTEKGRQVVGTKFKGYSTSYINSPEFELRGKSASNVNLELFGDMLDSIDIQDVDGSIEIGFSDQLQSNKAYNHDTGDTLPKRQFFNINQKEWNDIKRQFKKPASTEQDLDVETARFLSTEPEAVGTLGDLFPSLFEVGDG